VQFWQIFYFTSVGFQCTAKGIFIPKDIKLGEISTKKVLKNFSKEFKEWGFIRGLFLLLFECEYLGNMKS